MAELPDGLIRELQAGNVVLFLGAGASIEARTPQGEAALLGKGLAQRMAETFLSPRYHDKDLQTVSKYAEAKAGTAKVHELVDAVYRPLLPTPAHRALTEFRWRAVATTNYDLLLEEAYAGASSPRQRLIPWVRNRDQISRHLQDPSSLLYLKLHGCLDHRMDPDVPLILTPEQYNQHRQNRSNLYDHLRTLAFEASVVYVGSSLADHDLLHFIQLLDDELAGDRPLHYVIDPYLDDEQVPYFQQKRIHPLKMGFSEWIAQVEAAVPSAKRALMGLLAPSHAIERRLIRPSATLPNLPRLLETECHHVHPAMALPPERAEDFYKGKLSGFFPIAQNFDVRRSRTTPVINALLAEGERTTSGMVLLGPAGAGKSVLLKRLAWELAEQGRLCLMPREGRSLDTGALEELLGAIDERLYLFVDDVTACVEDVELLVRRARTNNTPLTVVSTARTNEWNAYREDLDAMFGHKEVVRDLHEDEVQRLLTLLERHRCLGVLEPLTPEERFERLKVGAQRQLLVGLYEATQGRDFEEILLDEYRRLTPPEAQVFYRGVCLLHRLGLLVRAPLLQKMYRIPHGDFRERLFLPLQGVVFESHHPAHGPSYRTRHPEIARVLFERVWTTPERQLEEVSRLLPLLNPSYEDDDRALRALINHRNLLEHYGDIPAAVRKLYAAALERGDRSMVLRQHGLFEMRRRGADLAEAERLLLLAQEAAPRDAYVLHALGELRVVQARQGDPEMCLRRCAEGRDVLAPLLARPNHRSAALHTLGKLALLELDHTLRLGSPDLILERTETVTHLIEKASEEFPGEARFIQLQADLHRRFAEGEQALEALEKAFALAPDRVQVAQQLIRFYQRSARPEDAQRIVHVALEHNPDNRQLNFAAFEILRGEASAGVLMRHLLRSFGEGDQNFEAQFWYARYAHEFGSPEERRRSERLFDKLRARKELGKRRFQVLDHAERRDHPFTGTVVLKRSEHGFIRVNWDGKDVNFTPESIGTSAWSRLVEGSRVSFQVAYRYAGPIAVQLEVLG